MNHNNAPLFDTLLEYSKRDVTAFDVPGHKQGLYSNRFIDMMGELKRLDVNSMPELDLLSKPTTIIKEAQDLFADAYNVDNSFFLINGTTIGILAMISASVKKGDKIIVPRNVHKSVISALTLSGAIPIYVQPDYDSEYAIMNAVDSKQIIAKIESEKDVKAVLLVIPTYFGVIGDYENLISYCRERNIATLIDMAHGSHLKFCGDYDEYFKADLIAISTHKTLGSMSQSSVLLHNNGVVDKQAVTEALLLYTSTSASYLLMASIDEVRRDVMVNKLGVFSELTKTVRSIKDELNSIKGISCIDKEYCSCDTRYKLDPFKLTIKINELGLNGFEVYKMLKERFDIQIELAESYTILALVSLADSYETLSRLVEALKKISDEYYGREVFKIETLQTSELQMKLTPNQAYNSKKKKVLLKESINKVSGGTIMIYPPGIPICLPGEVINKSVVDLLEFYKKQTIFTFSGSEKDLVDIIVEEEHEF